MEEMDWLTVAYGVVSLAVCLLVRHLEREQKRQMEIDRQEALLKIAIESFDPCPEEACGDCGQETYGEDHACTYLTTLDVACIRRSTGQRKS